MKNIGLLLLALLTGCAASREVRLTDGWPAYEINCSGPLASFGDCLEKAGKLCPVGYIALDKAGGELPASDTAMPTGGLSNLSMRYEVRKLFVKCR